jgi:hypothetical protein
MEAFFGAPIHAVLQQHAEESVFLRRARSWLVRAPQVKLKHLLRHDKRIEAHLDGLAIAGEHGWSACGSTLQALGLDAIFPLTILAL